MSFKCLGNAKFAVMPNMPFAKHEDGLEFFLQKLLILLPLAFIHLVAEDERQRLQNVRVKPACRSSCLKCYARRQEESLVIFVFWSRKTEEQILAALAWHEMPLPFYFSSSLVIAHYCSGW